MIEIDSMGADLQLFGGRFSNFLLEKVSLEFNFTECRYFTTFKSPYISVLGDATVTWLGTLVVTYTVYVDVILTLSKVKVKVTGLLNFRQLAKPCMLAAMTAVPLRGFLVSLWF